MELKNAQHLAEIILAAITPHVSRSSVAGSVRRLKPNVKDIEVLAIVTDYAGLFTALRPLGRFIKPGVPDVIDWPPKPGAKYVRMLLNEGVKLDLFIANPDNWGGLLAMRTGPAVAPSGNVHNAFVPALFRAWKRASGGGRMSEGRPTLPDGTQLSCSDEHEFFRLCGVEWVEPHERLDSKSLRKAKK